MSTSRIDIAKWMARGRKEGATHLIVMVDGFDHEDYPVYVPKDRNFWEIYNEQNSAAMQNPMEVYDLTKPFREQLDQARCWNVPPKVKFPMVPAGGLGIMALRLACMKTRTIWHGDEQLVEREQLTPECQTSIEYYRIIDRITNGDPP